MRVLAISSQVAYGPVGLTAAVPALQAKGHEVLAVPTITLSNHPGHGRPAGFRTQPDDLNAMLGTLEAMGVLAQTAAVLTGYIASEAQVDAVETVLVRMKAASPTLFLLADPVVGDEGGLYVAEDVAAAIRDRLVPLASCITPNRFELSWLSGKEVGDEDEALAAARIMAAPEVLATSIPAGDRLATMAIHADGHHTVLNRKLAQVPHGTGDFLSGLYLAERLHLPPQEALAAAMKQLSRAIARSAGTPVLDVAGALHGA